MFTVLCVCFTQLLTVNILLLAQSSALLISFCDHSFVSHWKQKCDVRLPVPQILNVSSYRAKNSISVFLLICLSEFQISKVSDTHLVYSKRWYLSKQIISKTILNKKKIKWQCANWSVSFCWFWFISFPHFNYDILKTRNPIFVLIE